MISDKIYHFHVAFHAFPCVTDITKEVPQQTDRIIPLQTRMFLQQKKITPPLPVIS